MSNIDYDVILESVKKYHSTEHYTAVNRFALEMISAYDETGNKKLLKAVIKLTKWLHTENPDDYYHLLNWYQRCIERTGEINILITIDFVILWMKLKMMP